MNNLEKLINDAKEEFKTKFFLGNQSLTNEVLDTIECNLTKAYNYVYNNIMAESWDDENTLSEEAVDFISDTHQEALNKAFDLEKDDFTEYGIIDEVLAKDGAEVIIK